VVANEVVLAQTSLETNNKPAEDPLNRVHIALFYCTTQMILCSCFSQVSDSDADIETHTCLRPSSAL